MAKTKPIWYDLSPKRKAFAEAWATHRSNKQAAIDAGYSPKHADQQGSRLYSDVKIKAYCDYLTQTVFDKLGITREWIASEIKSIAEAELQDYFHEDGKLKTKDELTLHQRRNIQEMQFHPRGGGLKMIKLYSRQTALQDLKRMGGYDEPLPTSNVKATVKSGKAEQSDTKVIEIELDF